jgi:hypothetical protein
MGVLKTNGCVQSNLLKLAAVIQKGAELRSHIRHKENVRWFGKEGGSSACWIIRAPPSYDVLRDSDRLFNGINDLIIDLTRRVKTLAQLYSEYCTSIVIR